MYHACLHESPLSMQKQWRHLHWNPVQHSYVALSVGGVDGGSYLHIRATISTLISSIDRLTEMSCVATSIPSCLLISARRKRSTKTCLFVAQDDLRKGLINKRKAPSEHRKGRRIK